MSASAKSSGHQRAQPATARAVGIRGPRLEPDHDREPADDDDPGRDGARAGEAEVESVAREQVAGDDPDPDRHAGRDREARDRLQEALGPPRAGARREREQEGGDADRDRRGDRELARQQREGRRSGSPTARPTRP